MTLRKKQIDKCTKVERWRKIYDRRTEVGGTYPKKIRKKLTSGQKNFLHEVGEQRIKNRH